MLGAHPASDRRQQSAFADSDERADHDPVAERDHDPQADPVERASAPGADAERDRQERHHERDEREGELLVQVDPERDHVGAALGELVDVASELADRHHVSHRLLGLEVVWRSPDLRASAA